MQLLRIRSLLRVSGSKRVSAIIAGGALAVILAAPAIACDGGSKGSDSHPSQQASADNAKGDKSDNSKADGTSKGSSSESDKTDKSATDTDKDGDTNNGVDKDADDTAATSGGNSGTTSTPTGSTGGVSGASAGGSKPSGNVAAASGASTGAVRAASTTVPSLPVSGRMVTVPARPGASFGLLAGFGLLLLLVTSAVILRSMRSRGDTL